MPVLTTVYVSVGNSDDKLTQARWSQFHEQVTGACRRRARRVYGDWLSLPNAPYQNACIAFAIHPGDTGVLKKELRDLAAAYGQESIAWAEAATEFLAPLTAAPAAARTGMDRARDAIRAARGGPAPVTIRGFA